MGLILRIHDEKINISQKKIISFRLLSYGDELGLAAVDPQGKPLLNGYILSITPDGFLYKHPYLNPSLGLKLDIVGGSIKEV